MLNGCSTMFEYDPFPLLKRKEKKRKRTKKEKRKQYAFFIHYFLWKKLEKSALNIILDFISKTAICAIPFNFIKYICQLKCAHLFCLNLEPIES